jgi:hypothetical protein
MIIDLNYPVNKVAKETCGHSGTCGSLTNLISNTGVEKLPPFFFSSPLEGGAQEVCDGRGCVRPRSPPLNDRLTHLAPAFPFLATKQV